MPKRLAENLPKLNRLHIRSLLAGKDLTVSDLARALNISIPHLHDMLYGRRNGMRYAQRIADFLHVALGDILDTDSGSQSGVTSLAASAK